jgi:hypothetical protein
MAAISCLLPSFETLAAQAPQDEVGCFSNTTIDDRLILRSALFARVSKDGPRVTWFETALKKRLLTMRV